MSLFNTGFSHARRLTPVLLATALAACGGGGGSSGSGGGGQVPFLTIDENNAGPLLYLTLQGSEAFTLPQRFATILFTMEGECGSGSISVAEGPNGPTSATASNCELTDAGTPIILDGTVNYDYDGGDIVEVETSAFNVRIDDPLGADILIGGDFDYDFSNGDLDRFTDTDLQIDVRGPTEDGQGEYRINWLVDNLTTTQDYSDPAVITSTIEGTLLVDGGAERVSITTNQPIIQSTDGSDCPSSGDVRLRGANNTHAEVKFIDANSITVTINGNAEPYTCEQFGDYMTEAENTFIE
ncbi:hypothetical protein RYH70_04780 [Alloalcanivorax xenomutans]|uniref:hypothetical protein n=1 Tax=Alloalcanivorax xenomutans TaxID=1094342 RepID=UPI0029343567|nr:hypothetical protein [Alloalcanivorax xenomutans]WOD29378.1 hypothetical protein RYH70_04780 [Alloalcanivorax xenomutans]